MLGNAHIHFIYKNEIDLYHTKNEAKNTLFFQLLIDKVFWRVWPGKSNTFSNKA